MLISTIYFFYTMIIFMLVVKRFITYVVLKSRIQNHTIKTFIFILCKIKLLKLVKIKKK